MLQQFCPFFLEPLTHDLQPPSLSLCRTCDGVTSDPRPVTPPIPADLERARLLLLGLGSSNRYRYEVTVTSTVTYTDLSFTVAKYRLDCSTELATLPACPAPEVEEVMC